jgi:hypothetical protein
MYSLATIIKSIQYRGLTRSASKKKKSNQRASSYSKSGYALPMHDQVDRGNVVAGQQAGPVVNA